MQLEPGSSLAAKYRITRALGEGGMGLVYEAVHEALGTPVAIKVLRDEVLKDREAVARFAREGRAAAALRSPYAARVLDVGEADGGRPFMVMELLIGNDLGEELERRGALPVSEAVAYMVQACEAIAEAHALGIVHRDLKPANLFLVQAGAQRIVKVLDFGISRFDTLSEQRVTQTQSAFGTPLYMSPEALRSAKHTDARSDVWSFGVMLYELLTGLPPFIADTPTGVAIAVTVEKPKPIRDKRPDVSEELEAVVFKAMDKDVSRRFQNAAELRDALEKIQGSDHQMSLPPPPTLEDRGQVAGATAQSQKLSETTRTGEPLSGAVPKESKSRLAVVAAVAIATCAATLSGFALMRTRNVPPAPIQPATEGSGAVADADGEIVLRMSDATADTATPTSAVSETAKAADANSIPTAQASSTSTEPVATAPKSAGPATAQEPTVQRPPPAATSTPPPKTTQPGGNPLRL